MQYIYALDIETGQIQARSLDRDMLAIITIIAIIINIFS